MKKIINAVWIDKDIDDVFWITNQIDDWYLLFSEYETSKVLERNGNWMRFRLKTKQEGGHPSAEWISERTIDPKNYRCEACRKEPMYPFQTMDISWEYQTYDGGTLMIWKQQFEMDEKCPVNETDFAKNLTQKTIGQMQVIKEKIETGQMTGKKTTKRKPILQAIKESVGIDGPPIDGSLTYDDLGIDSIEMVQLAADLEENFDMELDLDKMKSAQTIQELVRYIVKTKVRTMIAHMLMIQVEELQTDVEFQETGDFDSSNLFQLLSDIEDMFCVHFSDETDFLSMNTIQKIEEQTVTCALLNEQK